MRSGLEMWVCGDRGTMWHCLLLGRGVHAFVKSIWWWVLSLWLIPLYMGECSNSCFIFNINIYSSPDLHLIQLFKLITKTLEEECSQSVQSLSRVWLFAVPWTAAHQGSLSTTSSWSLLKLMSMESVRPSNHLIFVVPFFSCLPSFPASRSFQMSQLFASDIDVKVSKYWSFSFSINPSNEYLGLISFRIDRFDLLAVQGTLKSLLRYHSSKASILWHSAFFIVQRSHPYMTTGKTIALTRWTFVGKVMSLLFNTLSRLVIAFLPRSKRLLISWLQSPSAVILKPKKIKSVTVSIVSHLPWSDGTGYHDPGFLNVEF